jgi:hypothetical protein
VTLDINTYINILTVCLNLFHVAASQNHTSLHCVPTVDSNAVPTVDSNAVPTVDSNAVPTADSYS